MVMNVEFPINIIVIGALDCFPLLVNFSWMKPIIIITGDNDNCTKALWSVL